MKRNMLLGSVVMAAALCQQGFGFELLDRVLGVGCCDPCGKTCNTCDPCGDNGCAPACCDPCGDNGCRETACCKKRSGGLLDGLLARKRCCKPACCAKAGDQGCCEPACCEPACK